jgi:exodeoxyribonuclease V alpha subunit
MSELVRALRDAEVLTALDEQLARTLCRLVGERDERVLLAIALLHRHVTSGHVCLPLRELANQEALLGGDHGAVTGTWPAPAAWLEALRASPACSAQLTATTPLVLDGEGRLYLRRHFQCERALGELLRKRARQLVPADQARVSARLSHHFGDAPSDLQRSAAELATRRALCVISGGPGTGKTSTVVKILAVAVEEALASGTRPRASAWSRPPARPPCACRSPCAAPKPGSRVSRACSRRSPKKRPPSIAFWRAADAARATSRARATSACRSTCCSWTRRRWSTSS